MLEELVEVIKGCRGLALCLRNEGVIGLYKFEKGFSNKIEGVICACYDEKYLKVENDYKKTYDNIVEVLAESVMFREDDKLMEETIIKLLKDKSFVNLEKKSRNLGYTDFVMSNDKFNLFLY